MLTSKKNMNRKKVIDRLEKLEKSLMDSKKRKFVSLVVQVSNYESSYFIDEENVIVATKNTREDSKNNYLMTHYRYDNGLLKEMNSWDRNINYFDCRKDKINKDLNLVLIQKDYDDNYIEYGCDSIYNYKTCQFIVKKDIFDFISQTNDIAGVNCKTKEVNYVKENDCFLGMFRLSSQYQEDDILNYINPVTKENIVYSFTMKETYFAFINIDGTIRGNKLFRGESLSKIEKVINLEEFESLKQFKKNRILEITIEKEEKKQEFYSDVLNKTPYKDYAVEKVLKNR